MDQVDEEIVVSNIGDPSKEVFHIRDRSKNFYMLGSLGMASSISLGLALSQEETVVCLDGDGSLLTNLGSLATIANQNPRNLIIVAIDNKAYGTTGNQKSYTYGKTDLNKLAKACGFVNCFKVKNEKELVTNFNKCLITNELSFIHVLVDTDAMKMSYVPLDPINIKKRFMKGIS
jgi:sulfopyruvate decarboxylase subunit beta